MNKTLKIVLVVLLGLFVISGALKVIDVLFTVTFGLISAVANSVFSIMFSPVVLVAIILFLLWKINKKN